MTKTNKAQSNTTSWLKNENPFAGKSIALKELSAYLGLSQSTVSRIINGGATAHRIAEATQRRVLEAAALFGYEATIIAPSLRQKRTFTVAVLLPTTTAPYPTPVLSAIQ